MANITDKIRKLLELAKSDNEHEAAAAAARAAELMVEHQIELAEIEAAKPETERRVAPAGKVVLDSFDRTVTWKWWLQSSLADAHGGVAFYERARQATAAGETDAVVIGPQPALDAISYLYKYLTQEVERLADAAYAAEHAECARSRVTPPSARSWKNAFRNGASLEIADRVRKQAQATTARARAAETSSARRDLPRASTTALAIIDRQSEACLDLARKEAPYLFRKDGKMKGGTSVSLNTGSTGYAAGRSAGASVNIGGGRQLGAGRAQLRGGR
jgi:hypothetical protein